MNWCWDRDRVGLYYIASLDPRMCHSHIYADSYIYWQQNNGTASKHQLQMSPRILSMYVVCIYTNNNLGVYS